MAWFRTNSVFASSALAIAAALAAGPAPGQAAPPASPVGADAPFATQSPPGPSSGAAPVAAVRSGADDAADSPASTSMVVNLMQLLVKRGVLTQTEADSLRQQAQAAADRQRAAAAASATGATAPPALAAETPPPAGVIRIPYVPQVVRNQIRDDIKKDVLAQAQAEGWANPRSLPTWLGQVHFFGDMRFRDEYDLYSSNNITQFIDYNTFNNNGPTDVDAATSPHGLPFLNTRQDRLNQLSIRARFGVAFQPSDWVSLTFRLGSGQDAGPVSNTQLLGGGLTKKDVWLDQAYVTLAPGHIGWLNVGRMPDMFLHTDLLFDDNLEFDGALAVTNQSVVGDTLRVFGSAGVFPLGYVPGAFPSNDSTKTPDSGKWLFSVQSGAQYQPREGGWSVRAAAAFYDYDNVAGHLSEPCATYEGINQCSTDSSRPAYMQKGNTLFQIRNITPNPNPGNYAYPQFVGLSYNYHELDIVGEFEAPVFGSLRALLTGDYVRNLAYDPGRMLAAAAANPQRAPVTNINVAANGVTGVYQSGPNAFNVRAIFGHIHPSDKGDWNFQIGYKYIEPDAVIDAFNSNDFHMGGTNAKGYYMVASYYIAHNTWLDGRWFSATEVFGAPLAIDVLQLELQTRF